MMIDLDAVARQAYEAYGHITEFRNYQGLPMPTYDDLGEKIQAAWQAAASAIIDAVCTTIDDDVD